MYKYKLKEEYLKDGERTFIGFGVTEKGFISSPTKIESPLLDFVGEEKAEAPAAPAQTAAPTSPAPAQPQQPQTPAAPAASKENA